MAFNPENIVLPIEEYFQLALLEYNKDADGNKQTWFGWKKEDDNGNVIPNDQRMTYANILIIKDGATMPTEAEVNAKMVELRNLHIADLNTQNEKMLSGKQKLRDLGLTDDEIAQIYPWETSANCIGY